MIYWINMGLNSLCLGNGLPFLDSFLKTGNQFQIDNPGSKPLGHGIGHV
jgi:hypothetical protein